MLAEGADARRFARRMRPLLGTFVEIGVDRERRDEVSIQAAFAAIEQVQSSVSFQDPDSDLSRLNRHPGQFVNLSTLTLRILRLARSMTLATGGLFNCTVGGALVRRGVLPDHTGSEPLDVGAPEDIEIGRAGARLARPIRVTVDGIAKGYAVDRAVHTLQRCGIANGWVNAGGDVRVFGAHVLPVARRETDGSLRPLGGVRQAALATSVVYDQPTKAFPGKIIAASGCNVIPGIWSVLSHSAWRADALTKVAAVAPPWARDSLLRVLGGQLAAPVLRS